MYRIIFQQLLDKDQSCTIHERNIKLLVIEMYRVRHNLAPLVMSKIFPMRNCNLTLRSESNLLSRNVRSVYCGTNNISFQGPKIWAYIPSDMKNAISLTEFKAKLVRWKATGCSCRICTPYIQSLGFL